MYFLSRFGEAVVEHDLRAVAPGIGDLDRRRIGGHDDDRGQPQERCRCGDALGMVAGGIGDHAAGAIPLRNPADAVVGAAELEGTRSEEHTSELQSLMRTSY